MSDLAALKAQTRKTAASARLAAHGRGQGQAAEMLADLLAGHAGKVLAGYMPMRSEIDPLAAMAAHAGPVAVPVIPGRDMPLRFREWSPGAAMIEGAYKAMIPAEGAWLAPEVLIVPLLAFDSRGYRLGYGGGYYDRTLQMLRAKRPTLAIGFAFAAQQIDLVPIEPTDQPLDAVVTEAGIVQFKHPL